MAEGTLVAEGTAANGTPVKVYDEGGLKVARDEAGNRLTHSDTLEGLKGAGFKLEEAAEVPPQEKPPETDPPEGSEPDPKPEPEPDMKHDGGGEQPPETDSAE